MTEWKVRTLKDAYKPREALKYLVEPIITLPSLNIFYGAPGNMKTLLLMDMAICIASGQDWLPFAPWVDKLERFIPFKVIQAPVVWIDLDIGKRRSDERFEALGKARKLKTDIPLFYYSMPIPMLDASNQDMMKFYEKVIQQHKAKFVVVDNLGVVKGKAKENDDSMTMVMSAFRQISERNEISQEIIHHQRKGANGDNGNNNRIGESLRGFGSIEASLDYAFLIDRINDTSDTLKIMSTKTRDIDIPPFGAKFTFESKDNRELKTAKFFGLSIEDKRPDAMMKKYIIKALEGKKKGLNKAEIVEIVNKATTIGKTRIGQKIDELATLGEINMKPGVRTEKIYTYLNGKEKKMRLSEIQGLQEYIESLKQ